MIVLWVFAGLLGSAAWFAAVYTLVSGVIRRREWRKRLDARMDFVYRLCLQVQADRIEWVVRSVDIPDDIEGLD